MKSLIKGSEEKSRWYPRSTDEYKDSVKIPNQPKEYCRYRSNFAYSMQYIEYLEKQLAELKLSSVLETMLYKSYILTGMSIIELIFTYILKQSGKWTTSEWMEDYVINSNPKVHNDKTIKVETRVSHKVDSFPVQMSLDSMIKKVENQKLLTIDHKIYPALKYLRGLRNRVHLQEGQSSTDHDFNAFNLHEVQVMRKVLYIVLTSPEVCFDRNLYKFLKDSYERNYPPSKT